MINDLRTVLRLLARSKNLVLASVVMLGLASGAATAIFCVVDAALLRPLPYPEPDDLVALSYVDANGAPSTSASPRAFLDWRERQRTFRQLVAVSGATAVLLRDGAPERVHLTKVSGEFFAMLGVRPLVGHLFGREAEEPGRSRIAVLGHGFWLRNYGGDPEALGRSLRTDLGSYEIVGVLPATFQYPAGRSPEIVIPIAFTVGDRQAGTVQSAGLAVEGRLASPVELPLAAAHLSSIEASLRSTRSEFNRIHSVRLTPLHEKLTGASRRWALLLLAGLGVVVLVACLNVASLFLMHASDRVAQFSLSAALGATPRRLARQIALQSAIIALAGAAVGTVLAWWGVDFLRAATPRSIPRASTIALDLRAVGLISCVVLISGLACAIPPAWKARRVDPTSFRGGAQAIASGRAGDRLAQGLAFAELAGALLLIVGSALLVTSYARLMRVDPGFRTADVLAMAVELPSLSSKEGLSASTEDLLRDLKTIPGVENAALGQNSRPFSIAAMSIPVIVPGREGAPIPLIIRTVTPEYLSLLGIALRQGRGLNARDNAGAPLVTVVNETAARTLFSQTDPVGKHLAFGKWRYEIVGVASDIRHKGPAIPPEAEMFVPFAQRASSGGATLLLRVPGHGEATRAAIRSRVLAWSPGRPITDTTLLDEAAYRTAAPARFTMFVLTILAVVALATAVIGVYAVFAHIVRRRTREVAVRLALGAQPQEIRRLFLTEGGAVIALGLAAGLLLAWYFARALDRFVFEVHVHDSRVFLAAALLLGLAALAACWFPVRRASRVDPLATLRSL